MVKISIISGFLGAGKTTFIKKLLQEKYFGSAPVLIENDYGSLGIDSLVMETTGVQVREITSGCICCSLIGNFILALEELIQKQHPEHIIIEPSGVGKLSEILEALNELEVPFEKHLVLTIVDAKRFYYNNQYVTEYFWDQISNADAVVFSKTKRMSGKELSALCGNIHNKIPDMEVICVPWDINYRSILDELSDSQSAVPLKHGRLDEENADFADLSGYNELAPENAVSFQYNELAPENAVSSQYNELAPENAVSHRISAPQHMLPMQMLSRKHTSSRPGVSAFSLPGTKRRQTSVFESWSTETGLEYSTARLHEIIDALNQNRYGAIVRAKGVLNNPQGSVLLDYVPGEGKLSSISQEETGRLLVIGMNLNRVALERLFLT